MSEYYINIHVRSTGAAPVRQALATLFADLGFQPAGDEAAREAVDDEDTLPDGDDWYGVLVSGGSQAGWTSVYVDDWQDSGVLAKGLSARLGAPVLEVWVAENAHWGYTYYEDGLVRDRFADDPSKVAATPAEAQGLMGQPEELAAILRVSRTDFQQTLRDAQDGAGEFVGPAIDAFGQAVGVPFDHIMIGYESFFEDDPDDYTPGLSQWPQWRHLAFRHPHGREQLAD